MLSVQTLNNLMKGKFNTKFRVGKYYRPITIEVEKGRMLFHFGYDKELIEEIKTTFENRMYHGYLDGDNRKLWSAPITPRNLFRLEALQGKFAPDPYARWSDFKDLTSYVADYCKSRTPALELYDHQLQMVSEALQAKWYLMAAEMGTGKTLAAFMTIELLAKMRNADWNYGEILWVGPKPALAAAKNEYRKWQPNFIPQYYTYDGLRKLVETWTSGRPAPRVFVMDESSRCKTPTTKRSIACQHIADAMRTEYGVDCYIYELSGTPAPKSPPDWWKQCEILCPGFIREANIHIFRDRLAYIEERETTPGAGMYKFVKAWKDTPDRCKHCGELKEHPNHDVQARVFGQEATHEFHNFIPGTCEVAKLKSRLKGLVGVWLKKDCLDLPEKRYEVVELEPSAEILNAAKLVVQTSRRTVDALIRLRTLSDGFLYTDVDTGKRGTCTGCGGTGKVLHYFEKDNPYDIILDEEREGNFRYVYSECPIDDDPVDFIPEVIGKREAVFDCESIDCYTCEGSGEVVILERKITEVPCPKVDLHKRLLGEHEECGRLNVYAGFEGSIIRCVGTAVREGWHVFKADGKGWVWYDPQFKQVPMKPEDMVYAYQERQNDFPRVCFVGQPGAAGMGLTLTASPTTFFYSNDFNPESRQQAEDRGHRIGMDVIRGGRIVDCIHLPSDLRVIDTLKRSKMLQLMSLTGLRKMFQ